VIFFYSINYELVNYFLLFWHSVFINKSTID